MCMHRRFSREQCCSMEPLEETTTALPPPKGVSFTFQKKASSSKVRRGEESNRDKKEEEGRDFVVSLDEKEIQSVKPKPKEKEFVVPLIRQNKWRLPAKKSEEGSRHGEEEKGMEEGKSKEEAALEKEAVEAIMRDIQESKLRGLEPRDDGLVVPLMMQNKPPVVEGREGDELADVELRPEQSTMEDYEAMPIGSFGEAVLKGMGWRKGEAIGSTNKGLTEPIEFIPRASGLGLGAALRAPQETTKRIKKPGEVERKRHGPYIDKDGRVRHVKKVGEEIPEQPREGFSVGNYARVLKGPHEGLYGKIVLADEDTARVVLRLSINSQNVGFSQHHLEVVSESRYRRGDRGAESDYHDNKKGEKQYGLIRKKDTERLPSPRHDSSVTSRPVYGSEVVHDSSDHGRKLKKDRDWESDVGYSEGPSKRTKCEDRSSKVRTSGHEYHSADGNGLRQKSKGTKTSDSAQSSGLSKEKCWMASNLRVRIVDQKYRKGKFYNTKVVLLDVVSPDTCVCQTDEGRLLEGVKQRMLETVIPRTPGAAVMVVGGKKKGQIATILEQDRSDARAVVELSVTKEVLKLDFDDICEFIGEVEDM